MPKHTFDLNQETDDFQYVSASYSRYNSMNFPAERQQCRNEAHADLQTMINNVQDVSRQGLSDATRTLDYPVSGQTSTKTTLQAPLMQTSHRVEEATRHTGPEVNQCDSSIQEHTRSASSELDISQSGQDSAEATQILAKTTSDTTLSSAASSWTALDSGNSGEGTSVITPKRDTAAATILELHRHDEAAATLASLTSSTRTSPEDALPMIGDIDDEAVDDEREEDVLTLLTPVLQGVASRLEKERQKVNESFGASEERRGRSGDDEMVKAMINSTESDFVAGYGLRRRGKGAPKK